MDLSKVLETVRAVVKGYSSLLIPLGIVLVAIVAFIPSQLISSRLEATIERESITSGGKQVQSSLAQVVVKRQAEEEARYQDALLGDANEIELLLSRTTQRQLLLNDMFPEPKDRSMFIFKRFGDEFRQAVDALVESVNGRDCPSEAELRKHLAKAATDVRRVRRLAVGEIGTAIKDVLCRQKAEAATVYVNPADVKGYAFWEQFNYAEAESHDEALKQCWYWQLGYWIIEDVFSTVRALNSGSANVFASPVKRLMDISFTEGGRVRRLAYRGSTSQAEAGTEPQYVLGSQDGLVIPCCTRRTSNDYTDVVHFAVSVIVRADVVSDFMVELCRAKEHKFNGWYNEAQEQTFKHNQITVLSYRISSVEPGDQGHDMYRYGDDAVVKLDLNCEFVFHKQAYDEIKPQVVKTDVEEKRKELAEQKARLTRGRLPTRGRAPAGGGRSPRGREMPTDY
jgi:hypothetical protein